MTFTAAALMVLLMQNPGGSLYSDSSQSLFLFRDFKARNVSDILTIQVIESASASNSANTSTDKSGSVNVKAPALFGLENSNTRLDFSNMLLLSSALNFAGEGSTTRSGQLQAFVSAKVTEVFPNGDLGIEGVKEVTVNRERQILRIRGVVRRRDITANNVVLSTSIGNMEV